MKTWLRLTLITMTVGGGFTGVLLTIQSLSDFGSRGLLYLTLTASFLALYTFVIICGLRFVLDAQRTRPLLVALAIQIPWISTPLIVYKFASALHVVVTIGPPQETDHFGAHIGAEALLGSTFRFAWSQAVPWSLGVNLFALLLFAHLWRLVQTPGPASQAAISAPADSASPSTSTDSEQ